jgi:hypothetical protein
VIGTKARPAIGRQAADQGRGAQIAANVAKLGWSSFRFTLDGRANSQTSTIEHHSGDCCPTPLGCSVPSSHRL